MHELWPLSGAGWENLGPLTAVPTPQPGPGELLVRHDAVGICFSDIKVIHAGQNHLRIHHDMRQEPVVLGHEVCLTVMDVGTELSDRFTIGDRYLVQADLFVEGVSCAYGYELPGGFSEYGLIDRRALELGRAAEWRPARVYLDADLKASWPPSVEVVHGPPPPGATVDDAVVMSTDPAVIEGALSRLANGGVCAVATAEPIAGKVNLDVGRLHYDHICVVGTAGLDLSEAYAPVRSEPKPGGRLWVLGATGPLGQMHVQRALGSSTIVATGRRQARLDAVAAKFPGADIVWSTRDMGAGERFDDIAVMAPSADAITEAYAHLADGGVLNVFAGLPRGTLAPFDLDAVVRRGVRFIGTSGSSIEDLRRVRDLTESGTLSPNRSVAAIAGLDGVPDGLRAVAEGRFAGKVVIFPQLRFPLTPLTDLAETLPSAVAKAVAAKLDGNGGWTRAAEQELLLDCLVRNNIPFTIHTPDV